MRLERCRFKSLRHQTVACGSGTDISATPTQLQGWQKKKCFASALLYEYYCYIIITYFISVKLYIVLCIVVCTVELC